MVSISDELNERNILNLILIVRFAYATLDVRHALHPVIEQYLSIITDRKLKRHLVTALRTQSHQVIGLERAEIQNMDDDVAMGILGELPKQRLVLTIPEPLRR
jgi:replicative DNA helicase